MRLVRAFVIAVLLATVAGWPVAGQPPAEHPRVAQALELARIWLEAQRAYDQIPGVSAAIVYDQQILWAGAYGLADVEAGRPARVDTIYSICSISKLFTSVAVLEQRDAGKLRLDDPVRKYLPWFRIKPAEGESTDVSIEGLLTHASGLPRESDYPYWTGPAFDFPTREQVIDRLSSQQMLYPSETVFQVLEPRPFARRRGRLRGGWAAVCGPGAPGHPRAARLVEHDTRDASRRARQAPGDRIQRPWARGKTAGRAILHGKGHRPGGGLRVDGRGPGTVRRMAVPPAGQGRHRDPQGDDASRNAARALDRPRLHELGTAWGSRSGGAATRRSSDTGDPARASGRTCSSSPTRKWPRCSWPTRKA